jgi:CRP-like cAMP-binding protein
MSSGDLGRVYEDGELLIREGEPGDSMLVIQEGRAEILTERDGQEILLRTTEPGEMIGEMAIFERVVRSASVRAKGKVRALTVDKGNFLKRINEDPSLAFRLVKLMSQKLRATSEELAKYKASSSRA